MRYPIYKITVCHDDPTYLADIKELEEYLQKEINCLYVTYAEQRGLVKYRVTPIHKNIGRKYRKLAKAINAAIARIPEKDLYLYMDGKELTVEVNDVTYKLEDNEVKVKPIFKHKLQPTEQAEIVNSVLVMSDHQTNVEVINMYIKRMFIRYVQDLRKEAGLNPWDKIAVYHTCTDAVSTAIKYHKTAIETALLCTIEETEQPPETTMSKKCDFEGSQLFHATVYIVKLVN